MTCPSSHSQFMCACVLNRFSHVLLFAIQWWALQALLSMGFSRQEYGNGLPCPPPGIKPLFLTSLGLAAGSLPLASPGKPRWVSSAAAATKSHQSCPTLCDPTDGSPPGSPVPGILQARTLEWAAISFSNAWKWNVKVKSLSRVWLLATPRTATYQAPPSMGFSRQEYWSGPLPSLHWVYRQNQMETRVS